MPRRWAVSTTSTQALVGSLPLVSTQRTSSSRISAAVPGMDPRPASRTSVSQSAMLTPARAAALTTSIGLNACTCMPGAAATTARTMSA